MEDKLERSKDIKVQSSLFLKMLDYGLLSQVPNLQQGQFRKGKLPKGLPRQSGFIWSAARQRVERPTSSGGSYLHFKLGGRSSSQ